ncbi:had-superfamily subfamily variant 1 [Colletotrichum sojae]|uniref:Had-superfamily subfamily variant 1 n=1 Tax=Colletotrichum sojae TaxID=2175907 RepID=A0A8H6MZF1_9PEZI|nr:had-superfamily subfamily variant 1 [Colletotrichum sojae]
MSEFETSSEGEEAVRAVLFDLDNTLFDHHHSLKCAISAVRARFEFLQKFNEEELVNIYDASLRRAYDDYLEQKISYEEKDLQKLHIFFGVPGQPKGDTRRNQGTGFLREVGYCIAIVTNGQIEDQTEKAKAIGVSHLVDKIITSEEAGCCKPDKRVFDMAMEALGASPENTYMVGDNAEADVKGGLDAGLEAILYSPGSEDKERELFGTTVPVLDTMYDLTRLLAGGFPEFKPRIYYQDSYVIAEGFGIDVVIEPRQPLFMTHHNIGLLAKEMAGVFQGVAEKDYPDAISRGPQYDPENRRNRLIGRRDVRPGLVQLPPGASVYRAH